MKNRDVFLVTTSIKKTFPIKEKKILLAGKWCKDDVNEFFLNKYQFQTLPYHWDDEKKRSKDSLYLKKIYYNLSNLFFCKGTIVTAYTIIHSTRI